MPFELALRAPTGAPPLSRRALLAALGVVDDGASSFELGRPETGSTALVTVDDDGHGLTVLVPLARAPFLIEDLGPPLADAARALGAPLVERESGAALTDAAALAAAWRARRRDELRALARLCRESETAPPPSLPAAALASVHAWLVRLAAVDDDGGPVARLVLGLDPRGLEPATVAVRVPSSGPVRVPPLPIVLLDPDAPDDDAPLAPRLVPTARLARDGAPDDQGLLRLDIDHDARALAREAEDLSRFRVVSVVELLDDETLYGEDRDDA